MKSILMKRDVLGLFYYLFMVFLSLTVLSIWGYKKIYTVTGDEPHYLVMANGILTYNSFEQTLPYAEEFRSKDIYKNGLAPADTVVSAENTHAVRGPNGLYNVHNIGLPLLLAVPYGIAGVYGAKIAMVLLTGTMALLFFGFVNELKARSVTALLAIGAFVSSSSFVVSSAQIYPEIPAGIIMLSGLYWIRRAGRTSLLFNVIFGCVVAFLPWLQIKFGLASALIFIAWSIKYFKTKNVNLIDFAAVFFVAVLSMCALLAYNYYAFGKVAGPYTNGALSFELTALMVFLGLFLDQNHGFLFQSPILFLGFFGFFRFYRFDRILFLSWLLLCISTLFINSLHPVWYGGFSFNGRFGLPVAILWVVPSIFGVSTLVRLVGKNIAILVLLIVIAINSYLFFRFSSGDVWLFNKPADVWSLTYSVYYQPLSDYLPMFYNVDWAFSYKPNYAWIIVLTMLVLVGFLEGSEIRTRLITSRLLILAGVIAVFAGSESGVSHSHEFEIDSLGSNVGLRVHNTISVVDGADSEGYLLYGPYISLPDGLYELNLQYSSEVDGNLIFDIFDSNSGIQLFNAVLPATNSEFESNTIGFSVPPGDGIYEFRFYWNGSGGAAVKNYTIKQHF